jgi:GR25 family glycosyltransferase involved in LPS biosynthesis
MGLNSINTFVDKIFIINLDDKSSRYLFLKKQLDELGIVYERFQAIGGNSIDLGKFKSLKNGELGCLLSHISVLKIAEKNKLKSILILEDDAEFCENFHTKFEKYIKQVPEDWDMIYLGANHIEIPKLIRRNVLRIIKSYTSHAIIIRNSVFKEIIYNYIYYDKPYDAILAELIQPNYNCYCLYPHLVFQQNTYSYINKKNTNYDFIKEYKQPITFNYFLKRPCDAIRRTIKKFISFFT